MNRSEAGRKGALARHSKSSDEESRIARLAAATRKLKNPDAFRDMGKLGGLKKSDHSSKQIREKAETIE